MTNEIIELIEYITNSGLFKGAVIAYSIFAVVVLALVVSVFVITFKTMKNHRNRWK